MGELRQDLKRVGVELEETHISWVFLTDRDVWKVKKPVSLGFLDFSTKEKRHWGPGALTPRRGLEVISVSPAGRGLDDGAQSPAG